MRLSKMIDVLLVDDELALLEQAEIFLENNTKQRKVDLGDGCWRTFHDISGFF